MDRQQVEQVILKTASHRGTFHKLRRCLALRLQTREKSVAAEQHAGRFKPAFRECGLQVFDRRTFDPNVGVSPAILRPAVSQPGVTDSISAGEADSTIDHQNAAMIAIVILQHFPRKNNLRCFDAAEKFQLAAGLVQYLRYVFRDLAGAVAVQQEVGFYSRPAAFGKALGKSVGQRAALEQILGEGDGGFGFPYFTEHCRENRIAIWQNVDLIAAGDGRVGESFKGGKKGSIAELDVRHLVDRPHFGAAHEEQQSQPIQRNV